ncbi:hypothetical protein TH24_21270 [Thalassospira xiamenensis]|nr:hypothetical protein TH24_21270 [Thalassospira xiamenensis]
MMPLLAKWHKAAAPDSMLIGFDANPDVVSAGVDGFDRVFVVPKAYDPLYVPAVIDLLKEIGVSVLLPGSDEEALVLAKRKKEIESAGGMMAMSDHSSLARVSDKINLARVIEESHGGGARVLRALNADEALQAIQKLGGTDVPMVLKPSRGRGRRGVFIIGTSSMPEHDDLPPVITLQDIPEVYEQAFPPDMVMPFVSGQNITMDVLADHGEVAQLVVRRWLENWRFPFPGQEIISFPQIESLGTKIVNQFKLHGLLDMDFIVSEDGEPTLLEVNPRPSGSVVVALAGGVPLLKQYVNLALGQKSVEFFSPVRPQTLLLQDLEN